jgi:hypothetical protein
MALAVIIGLVSLIAILAVATLSLATRLVQDSSLGIRDARLDGAAAFGLAGAIDEWRSRGIGRLAVGATVAFPVAVAGLPVSASVAVTRVGADVFWVASEAGTGGGSVRRENLVLRRRMPDAQALLAEDSTNVETLGFLPVDSIVATADVVLAANSVLSAPSGVVHVTGNATVLGGKADGILVVDGILTVAGPLQYDGIIVAAGGIQVTSTGVVLTGLVRSGAFPSGSWTSVLSPSVAVVQDVMAQSLMPSAVAGRRWSELY